MFSTGTILGKKLIHLIRFSLVGFILTGFLQSGCSTRPWITDRVKVDRFRQDLAIANFRLQRDNFGEVSTRLQSLATDQSLGDHSRNSNGVDVYGRLVSDLVSYGTDRLQDRINEFDRIMVHVGTETFTVCLQNPFMQICDNSATPYLDRIQVDRPFADMKHVLDRVAGK